MTSTKKQFSKGFLFSSQSIRKLVMTEIVRQKVQDGKPKEFGSTLDEELIASLFFGQFVMKLNGWTDFSVYIDPNDRKVERLKKYIREKIGERTLRLPPKELRTFLKKYTDQNTQFDFYIFNPSNYKYIPVQFKLFVGGTNISSNHMKLCEQLRKWDIQYGKVGGTLLIHIRANSRIYFTTLRDFLRKNGIGFDGVVLYTIQLSNNSIVFSQIKPSDINEPPKGDIISLNEIWKPLNDLLRLKGAA